MKPIRKAVFPVAGMGTRFLPATKVMPKELFPIVDRPLLQYAVDEALEAGIEQMIFVNGRGKGMIEDHFDMAYELEHTMADRSKDRSVLDGTRFRPGDCVFVRQQEPLGLGHAIWCARDIIGDEPFAIFLPDEFMVGSPGCMKQMVSAYERLGGNIVCALEIPIEDTSSYGVIDPGYRNGPITEVKGLVEKPAAGTAPSNAMAQMIGKQPFHGMTFNGKRYDCGSKLGYVEANLAMALAHPEIGSDIRVMAEKLLAQR